MSQNTKLTSSKTEGKIAILFLWSLVITYPVLVVLTYYIQGLREIDIKGLFAALAIMACISLIVTSLIMFLIWFYKAYSILYQKTSDLKYKKYWTILSWIIPVINFYLPYLIIKDMYSVAAVNNPLTQKRIKKWTTINICWTLYIFMWILDIAYYIIVYPDRPVVFDAVTYILIAPSIWLTIKIIKDYCELEAKLFEKDGSSSYTIG
ncbi:MAG: DUF4328 domain-containing protein [Campylobacteraceae bacterium]|jgi:hypothetical protein|nr:DUF4328 domain-containing protein [Campylobacteraceae bacterium]